MDKLLEACLRPARETVKSVTTAINLNNALKADLNFFRVY